MGLKETNKPKGREWVFALAKDVDLANMPMTPSLDELYQKAMNTRTAKRETYERALNAALENLFSWERLARADGFSVIPLTDIHNGSPYPVFGDDGRTIRFVQAYGVKVEDDERK